jgi:membrane protein DedA with SNARE-associated domain
MLTGLLIAAAKPTVAHSVRRWIFHLGALGFIPLGLVDSSVIPVPGSMDVLTVVLASRTDRWLKKTFKIFQRWGFTSIAIPAILPPPIPLVPFLLVAGAMQYSVKKFLLAMTVGRLIRYSILAYLGGRYGRKMLPFLTAHVYVVLGVTLGLTAAGVAGYFLFRNKKEKKSKSKKKT